MTHDMFAFLVVLIIALLALGTALILVIFDTSKRKKVECELRISNGRLKTIFQKAGTGIVIRDFDGNFIDANPTYLGMLGYEIEQVKDLVKIVHQDDYNKLKNIDTRLASRNCYLNRSEIRYIHRNGDIVYADVISTTIPDTEHTMAGIIRIVNNITERKKMEEKLRESEERFRTAFNNAAIGIYLSSLDGRFLKVNGAFANLLGYSEEELVNMYQSQITHPDEYGTDARLLEQLLEGIIPNYHIESRYIHRNGDIIFVLLGISIVHNADSEPQYLICQVQNITLRKQAEEELEKARVKAERLARTDFLTGIMNRRAFMDRFEEEYYRVRREKTSISLIIVDIDNFKNINDSYGHQAGDLALQKFTQCLARVCRPYDFTGRIGGEEFAICLPNTSCKQAEKVAERMRRAVEALVVNLVYLKEPIKLTASFGLASPIKGDDESTDLLILHADTAMYEAKSSGRNKVCIYHKNDTRDIDIKL